MTFDTTNGIIRNITTGHQNRSNSAQSFLDILQIEYTCIYKVVEYSGTNRNADGKCRYTEYAEYQRKNKQIFVFEQLVSEIAAEVALFTYRVLSCHNQVPPFHI